MSNAIAQYRLLRQEVDSRVGALTRMHGPNIVCAPGCCECCHDITVFPVEYHAILDQLRREGRRTLELQANSSCALLKDGLCTIYAQRPLICRTHGLPAAVCAAEDDDERRVMFCGKNFAGIPGQELCFGPDNTLDLEEMNRQLAHINLRFAAERGMSADAAGRRIPLAQLAHDLNGT